MITTEDKLKCIEREMAMRNRVYPRWVVAGRMTQEQAKRELEIILAIAEDYRAAAEKERLI